MVTQNLKKCWYWYIVIFILFIEGIVFAIVGEGSYLGIHDNLDIHIADYQILKLNHAFFAHGQDVPLLGGIDRNFLLSELSLYSFLYMILPNFAAYMTGYFLKIGMALLGGILLGRDILKGDYKKYEWIVVLGSFTYGLLPLYPAFSFSFASLPLFLYLIRCIEAQKGKRYYVFVFLYPLLSYFTFFGPFLAGYLFIYALYSAIKRKGTAKRLFGAVVLLACGYVVMEYRLFYLIFASGEPTIRDAMVMESCDAGAIFGNIMTAFTDSIFHAEDLHRYFVLPIVCIYFVILNVNYIRHKEWKKIGQDPFNFILALILFNCIIYGFYSWEEFRKFVETLVPPLEGWQFSRTVFFNPFLWYLEIVIIAMRLMKASRSKLAVCLMTVTMLVVIGTQSLYNDFYNTVYVNAYEFLKQKESETLSYREFFSEELFEEIKEDIDYQGEYAVAYGFHPSVLSYNGISTLDACLSHYYQSYKEEFREVIAPALEQSEEARAYYDDWGGRAYIFSGKYDTIWDPTRTPKATEDALLIDVDAFENLGGTYIFSRINITNAEELGLELVGEYQHEDSPYTIWVWSR